MPLILTTEILLGLSYLQPKAEKSSGSIRKSKEILIDLRYVKKNNLSE